MTLQNTNWEKKKGVPAIPSLLYVAPHLYTITRDNILHCIEAASGNIVWVKRLAGAYSASPVFADGRIYILSEEGVTLVFKPGSEYTEVASNQLEGTFKASMAVSQGNLFLRSADALYCIGPTPRH